MMTNKSNFLCTASFVLASTMLSFSALANQTLSSHFNDEGRTFIKQETEEFINNLKNGVSLCDDMSAAATLTVRWSENQENPISYEDALLSTQQTCNQIETTLSQYQNTDTLTVAFASAGLKNGYGYAIVDLDAFIQYQVDIFQQCTEEAEQVQGLINKSKARASCREEIRASSDHSYILASKMEVIEDVSFEEIGIILGASHVNLPNVGNGDYYSYGVIGGGFSCLSRSNCYLAAGGVYINSFITVEDLIGFYDEHGLPIVAINIPMDNPGVAPTVVVAPTPEEATDTIKSFFNRK